MLNKRLIKIISLLMLIIFVNVLNIPKNLFIVPSVKAEGDDLIKIVGDWDDAGNWNFNDSRIIFQETYEKDIYYAEYQFTNNGSYQFKAVINGSIWCTGVPKVSNEYTNIKIDATAGQKVKFWFFKNTKLLIDSVHFPNGINDLKDSHSFKFVGFNNEWDPNDGKYTFQKVSDDSYTYIYDTTNTDTYSIPWGFKIIIGGFGSLSWAWNVAKENNKVTMKEGGDNIDFSPFNENGNFIKGKIYLDIQNGVLFTDKDFVMQPANFENGGTISIENKNIKFTLSEFTPNQNSVVRTIVYEIIYDNQVLESGEYDLQGGINIKDEWLGKNITIKTKVKIGNITGPENNYNVKIISILSTLPNEIVNELVYNVATVIDETYMLFNQGENIKNIKTDFKLVQSAVYELTYDNQIYKLNIPLIWTSSNPGVININGENAQVIRQSNDVQVKIYVAAKVGDIQSPQREFSLLVKARPNVLGVENGYLVTFRVTVPKYPNNQIDTLYIAGSFGTDKLPNWDPAGIKLTKVSEDTFELTLSLPQNAYIEYKYTRGNWDKVEKGAAGEEISNRSLIVKSDQMVITDEVKSFRDLGIPSAYTTGPVASQDEQQESNKAKVYSTLNDTKNIVTENTLNTISKTDKVEISYFAITNMKINKNKISFIINSRSTDKPSILLNKDVIKYLNYKNVEQLELRYPNFTITINLNELSPSKDTAISIEQIETKTVENQFLLMKKIDASIIDSYKVNINSEEKLSNCNIIFAINLRDKNTDGYIPMEYNGFSFKPIKRFTKYENKYILNTTANRTILFMKKDIKFNDVESLDSNLDLLAQLEIIKGDNSNNINLSKPISRAEFSAIISRSFDIKTEPFKKYFKDVGEKTWFSYYIEAVKSLNIFEGYNGNFYPYASITKEQLAKVAVQLYKRYVSDNIKVVQEEIKDINTASDWAKDYILTAVYLKILATNDIGNFNPKSVATREEAFKAIANVFIASNKNLLVYEPKEVENLVKGIPGGIPVTFIVKVPQNTPDEPIYIAGTFNSIGFSDWNPSDNELKLTKQEDGTYSITLYILEGSSISYKYVRGDWSKVEKGAQGDEIPNRTIIVNKNNERKMIINDQVLKWADR